MKTVKVKVFEYSELNKDAQEKARQWYLDGNSNDDFWCDFIKEDFHSFLTKAGFNHIESCFTGFCSQGDGACFEFKGLDIKTFLTIPKDGISGDYTNEYFDILKSWKLSNKELLRNIKRFHDVLYCKSERNSYGYHYAHSKTRYASVVFGPYSQRTFKRAEKFTNEFQEALTELMRSLADCYYKNLDSQWDYINSEESIKESIEANEYTFTKNGERFG
jgi:RNAse (barnase) inhibitor barstar